LVFEDTNFTSQNKDLGRDLSGRGQHGRTLDLFGRGTDHGHAQWEVPPKTQKRPERLTLRACYCEGKEKGPKRLTLRAYIQGAKGGS